MPRWRAAGTPPCEPVPAGARQCIRPSRARGAFHRRRPRALPFEGPRGVAMVAGQRPWPPHVFIDVRKPRLDLCPFAVDERLPGRVRLSGFCRWMFPRARLGTARTSHTTGEQWGRLPRSTESRLSIGQPPKGHRVRGREHRASTLPTVTAHGGDFAPTPIASGHLLSREPPASLSGVTWEEDDAATRRALARHAQREGRATPDFREEIGRSPTRGAFRRRPFAERTGRSHT
jgi:hypothetical protein